MNDGTENTVSREKQVNLSTKTIAPVLLVVSLISFDSDIEAIVEQAWTMVTVGRAP